MQVNELLRQLLASHGIQAVEENGQLLLQNRTIQANTRIFISKQELAFAQIQLDVLFSFPPGLTIVESFLGVGDTNEKAIADAWDNFIRSSFHVLLAAFLAPNDQMVTQEEWTIGDRKSQVTLGNPTIRGTLPVQGNEMMEWFHFFERKLKSHKLRSGTNWVRLYYGQMNGKAVSCEVLLNNFVWEELQAEMAEFNWPTSKAFYGIRIFLVIHVQPRIDTSPEEAVAWLADLVATREQFTEDDVYRALAEAGVPTVLADRAYKFTQVAWGRKLLAGLGITFSPDFAFLNASGDVVESGLMNDDRCFSEATRLSNRYARTPGFNGICMMSAEFNTVNTAMTAGSNPKNLRMSPSLFFLEQPTPSGLQRAKNAMQQRLELKTSEGSSPMAAASKPWWKFWS